VLHAVAGSFSQKKETLHKQKRPWEEFMDRRKPRRSINSGCFGKISPCFSTFQFFECPRLTVGHPSLLDASPESSLPPTHLLLTVHIHISISRNLYHCRTCRTATSPSIKHKRLQQARASSALKYRIKTGPSISPTTMSANRRSRLRIK
jgi:hypothetical protein